MKLLRVGNIGSEKPALIDDQNNFRDLTSVIDDLNPDNLNGITSGRVLGL